MMDLGSALTTASIVGTSIGGYLTGRMSGRSVASQIASDTVDMLQTQVDLLTNDKEHRDLELLDLRTRVTVLEELVTQRADVEELTGKISLVKETVDRIAERVGA